MIARAVKNALRRLLRTAIGEQESMDIVCKWLRSMFGFMGSGSSGTTTVPPPSTSSSTTAIRFSHESVLFWKVDVPELLQRYYPSCSGVNREAHEPCTIEWDKVHEYVDRVQLLSRLALLVGFSASRRPRGQTATPVPEAGSSSSNSNAASDDGGTGPGSGGEDQSSGNRNSRASMIGSGDRVRGQVGLTEDGDVDVSLFEPRYIQLHHTVRLGYALDIDQGNCLKALAKLHHEPLSRDMRRHLMVCVGYDTIPSQRSMTDYLKAARTYEQAIQDSQSASALATDSELRSELAQCYVWLARGSLARGDLVGYRSHMPSALQQYERAACLRPTDPAIMCNWGVALAEWATFATVYSYAHQTGDGFTASLPAPKRRAWIDAMAVAVRRFQWALLVSPIQYTAIDYWNQFQSVMLNASPQDMCATNKVASDVELLAIQLSMRLMVELLRDEHQASEFLSEALLLEKAVSDRAQISIGNLDLCRALMRLLTDSPQNSSLSHLALFSLYRLCHQTIEVRGMISPFGASTSSASRTSFSRALVDSGAVTYLLLLVDDVQRTLGEQFHHQYSVPLVLTQALTVLYEASATREGVTAIMDHDGLRRITWIVQHVRMPMSTFVFVSCLVRILSLVSGDGIPSVLRSSGVLHVLLDFLYYREEEIVCTVMRGVAYILKLDIEQSRKELSVTHFYLHVARILRSDDINTKHTRPLVRTTFLALLYLTNANQYEVLTDVSSVGGHTAVDTDVVHSLLRNDILPKILLFLGHTDTTTSDAATTVISVLCLHDGAVRYLKQMPALLERIIKHLQQVADTPVKRHALAILSS